MHTATTTSTDRAATLGAVALDLHLAGDRAAGRLADQLDVLVRALRDQPRPQNTRRSVRAPRRPERSKVAA